MRVKRARACQHGKCAISFNTLFITRIEQSIQGAGSNHHYQGRMTCFWRQQKVKLPKSRDVSPFLEELQKCTLKYNRAFTLHIQFKFVLQNSCLPDYCFASVIIFMNILPCGRDIQKPVVKDFANLEACKSSQLLPILFPNYSWRWAVDAE